MPTSCYVSVDRVECLLAVPLVGDMLAESVDASFAFGDVEWDFGEAVLDLGGVESSRRFGRFAGFSGGEVMLGESTSSKLGGLLRS